MNSYISFAERLGGNDEELELSEDDDRQIEAWESLYERLRILLLQCGSEDIDRAADCWLHDENLGTLQQKIYVRNLRLLRPEIVNAIRGILLEFPDWEIMVAVSVPGRGDEWPDMGLTIRSHEIVDGLEREYLPIEFRNIEYDDSRPGGEND